MRTLLLLRHAKSDWDAGAGEDFDRPLAKRGKKAAAEVGRFLRRAGAVPGEVLTSSAVRARTTVEVAAEAGGWDCPVRETRSLYEADPEDVVEEIRSLGSRAEVLLVAGHEPAWSSLLALLVGGGTFHLPTAALACVEFDADSWETLEPGRGRLAWLVNPKLLEAAGLA
jgi:phosphohistidine phosphatase